MPTIRVALAYTRFPSTREESLEIVLESMKAASAGAAAIICFPECFVPGYRIGAAGSMPDQNWLNLVWSIIDAKAAELGISVVLGTERIEAAGLLITVRVTNSHGAFAGEGKSHQEVRARQQFVSLFGQPLRRRLFLSSASPLSM